MAYRIKELLKVKVYAVFIAFIDDFLRLLQGLVRASSRAEPVTRFRELRFVYQAQYPGYGLLDDAVYYGWIPSARVLPPSLGISTLLTGLGR